MIAAERFVLVEAPIRIHGTPCWLVPWTVRLSPWATWTITVVIVEN